VAVTGEPGDRVPGLSDPGCPSARRTQTSPRDVASWPRRSRPRRLRARRRWAADSGRDHRYLYKGAGGASDRVGGGGGEIGESSKAQVKTAPETICAGPDRSTSRAPDSGARGGQTSPVASRAPTLWARNGVARRARPCAGKCSRASVISTNTKTRRNPKHVTWGSGFCGDSVGTDVSALKRDLGRDARWFGRPDLPHRPALAGRRWVPPSAAPKRSGGVPRRNHLYLYKGAERGPTVTSVCGEKTGSSGGARESQLVRIVLRPVPPGGRLCLVEFDDETVRSAAHTIEQWKWGAHAAGARSLERLPRRHPGQLGPDRRASSDR
jgi:hypothetical protein